MENSMTATAAEHGIHFTATHLGPLAQIACYSYIAPAYSPRAGRPVRGKVFLKEALGLTGIEISWNCFPPGASIPFLHTHRENEEVYMFLSGSGEFMVDGMSRPT